MSLQTETVIDVLKHQHVNLLPRGELFITTGFLDHFFSSLRGQYLKQLEAAAQSLGLSVVGVGLDAECSYSPLSEMRYKGLERYFLVGCISGPISRSIESHGFLNAMLIMKKDPSLFSRTAVKLLKETEEKAQLARANGFRAIAVTDDIAGSGGLLFSYDYFMEKVCPVYKEISEVIRENDLFAFFHSDGDTRRVIGPLIEAGYDCIHPVDTQAGLDLYELCQGLEDRVSFMGHIDTLSWNGKRVHEEIIHAEDRFTKGGLILGSTCGLSMETTNDNLKLLYPGWNRRGRDARE